MRYQITYVVIENCQRGVILNPTLGTYPLIVCTNMIGNGSLRLYSRKPHLLPLMQSVYNATSKFHIETLYIIKF